MPRPMATAPRPKEDVSLAPSTPIGICWFATHLGTQIAVGSPLVRSVGMAWVRLIEPTKEDA